MDRPENTQITPSRLCGARRLACDLIHDTAMPVTPTVELHCREVVSMSWSYADELIRDLAVLRPEQVEVWGAGDAVWGDLADRHRAHAPPYTLRRVSAPGAARS